MIFLFSDFRFLLKEETDTLVASLLEVPANYAKLVLADFIKEQFTKE